MHPIFRTDQAALPLPVSNPSQARVVPPIPARLSERSAPSAVPFDPSEKSQQVPMQGNDPKLAPELEDETVPSLEDEASGEGIGDEETLCGSTDQLELDDDIDPATGDMETGTKPKKRARPTRPPWFQARVESMKKQAKERNAQNGSRANNKKRTIWLTHEDTYFLLQKDCVTPQDLYQPQFCEWNPICFVDIPCPCCRTKLVGHGIIENPRQCVDFDSNFFIIGYRYRCPNCKSSKPGQASKTFQSWDSRILEVLPPALAAEFPAVLSRRSGMSVRLFEWMRSCFQSGMGPKQFSDSVRIQHLQRYDKLQLQYLQHLASRRGIDVWMNAQYRRFPSYDDTGPMGPCGFVPSGAWFCMVYKRFMDRHIAEIQQFIAMLPLTVGALDHSFKVRAPCSSIFLWCLLLYRLSSKLYG